MRRSVARYRVLQMVLLFEGLLVGTAHAQRFFPILPPNPRDRLQTASYLAQWEFPPISGDELPFQVESQSLKADAGPLLTMDYFLRRHLSVGFWWNRVSGEIAMQERGSRLALKLADAEADFWDIHVTYYFPERRGSGWSVQAGFNRLHYEVTPVFGLQRVGRPSSEITFTSPNIWVNHSQRVGIRNIGGRRRSIRLFGSLGYHTSAEFERSVDLMIGGALPVTRRLTLSSSVWLNDLHKTSTRVTIGLTGAF